MSSMAAARARTVMFLKGWPVMADDWYDLDLRLK